jgi:hypothetical protein
VANQRGQQRLGEEGALDQQVAILARPLGERGGAVGARQQHAQRRRSPARHLREQLGPRQIGHPLVVGHHRVVLALGEHRGRLPRRAHGVDGVGRVAQQPTQHQQVRDVVVDHQDARRVRHRRIVRQRKRNGNGKRRRKRKRERGERERERKRY